ncbi:MAG: CopG family ribbon-helix-helix protein [Methylophilaceae bacterium]
MVTTSLKLPDTLKQRIGILAEAASKTPHAFMVEALTEQAERAEKRHAFLQSAIEAKQEYEQTGIAYAAEDVHNYLKAKIQGKNPAKPQPIKR